MDADDKKLLLHLIAELREVAEKLQFKPELNLASSLLSLARLELLTSLNGISPEELEALCDAHLESFERSARTRTFPAPQ